MVSVDMVVQAAMVVGGIGSSGGWGQGGREGRQAGFEGLQHLNPN